MYVAIEGFTDRELGIYIKAGTIYPPQGRAVPDEWLKKLSSKNNSEGRAFIREAEYVGKNEVEVGKAVIEVPERNVEPETAAPKKSGGRPKSKG